VNDVQRATGRLLSGLDERDSRAITSSSPSPPPPPPIPPEFRANRTLTDPAKLRHAVEVAVRGVDTMCKYTRLDLKQTVWNVELEQDPLGQGMHFESVDVSSSGGGAEAGAEGESRKGDNGVRKLE
jgi:hypothetical protein